MMKVRKHDIDSISGTSTPLRKFVGDIGYHFSLSSIALFSDALHCSSLGDTIIKTKKNEIALSQWVSEADVTFLALQNVNTAIRQTMLNSEKVT